MENRVEAATVAATQGTSVPRIEIVAERRRQHDMEFRSRMVALSMAAGASVQELARQHGVGPSLIYRWRRLALSQAKPSPEVRLLPVHVTRPAEEKPPAIKPHGLIEIELANGVRVRVDAAVNASALRRVLDALRG